MKQKIVGVYGIGLQEVQVVLREGTGGEFYFAPESGKCCRIKVGADGDWKRCVSTVLHEAFEMEMTKSHCRFAPAPDFGCDHAGYLFQMDHPMFSDVVARLGGFLADCLPQLSRAYSAWHKKPSRRKTKTKK